MDYAALLLNETNPTKPNEALTIVEQERHLVVDAIASALSGHLFLLFNKPRKCGLFNFNGLVCPIVEIHSEVEEVGFAQIVGRRMLKMGA